MGLRASRPKNPVRRLSGPWGKAGTAATSRLRHDAADRIRPYGRMRAQLDEGGETVRQRELGGPCGGQRRSAARHDGDVRAAERAALAQQEAHPHRGAPGAGAAVAREGGEQLDGDRPVPQRGCDVEAVASDRVVHRSLADLLPRRVELRDPEIAELAPLLAWHPDVDDRT